jgi:hypothetical protein
MRFEFWTEPGMSFLKAHFEDTDSRVGKREEGMGTEITLVHDTVKFDYEVKSIHPDVLGLLCMVTFFPFIGDEAEFPQPVSPRLHKAFQNKCFTDKKNIRFRNIDSSIPMYSGDVIALSFGGGVDSSAVRQMFPEAFVVHEAHIKDGIVLPSHCHDVVKSLDSHGRVVQSNIRYLSQPGGWHSWPCSTSTSLLMATDMNFGIILTGSILGSCYLSNGTQFWDRNAATAWHGPTGNYWQSAFDAIGLPMFSPVTGVSEFQTMQLSMKLLNAGEVVYCMESDGSPCGTCSKCFRRDVIRTFLNETYVANWHLYQTESIIKFLQKRPMYFGHVFSTAFSLKPELYPDWVLNETKNLTQINNDWLMRVYIPSFELCDPEWRELITARVLEHINPMSQEDCSSLKEWNQNQIKN